LPPSRSSSLPDSRSSHRARVAVTGIGIISALGRGREAHTAAAVEGRIGIREITSIDSSLLDCRIAGEIPAVALAGDTAKFDRFTRIALIAAEEAVQQANLTDGSVDLSRVATCIGTGLGGCETLDASYQRLYEKGLTRMPPTVIPHIMYNAATSAVSARYGARGPAYAVVSACASGAHAIGQAADWIHAGRADTVLAGASDAPLSVGVIRGWESLRVLASGKPHPGAACRPFSADREGLVLAEGAAVFVLESFESAGRRGQQIIGEIAGFGLSSDAGHITDPSPLGAAQAMRLAIEEAGVRVGAIGYVNAHGTATRSNDPVETAALKEVFGPGAYAIPISSTKSMHGHAMGASGAIEIALSLLALNEGYIPPTMNLNIADPDCDLDYVPNQARKGMVKLFMSNSLGFGGMNGVVVVRTRHGL
jgi:nodulation protein E